ncbi:MAG: hypothetical protein KF813_00825 [Trueperaceae bacterium]|nr:hypothetical protein [Trueperaceae bacterium]
MLRTLSRTVLVGLLVAVVGLLSASFAQGVLKYAIAQPGIDGLDPHLEIPGGTVMQVYTMFNGLVRYPPGTTDVNAIEPDLAESFSSAESGRIWTFNLRRGVQFHDGYGELTASDVLFTFNRVMDPALASPWISQFGNVQSVTAPDEYTVVVELKEPDPLFLVNLAGHTRGSILSERAVTELGSQFRTNPIGTGPFQFTEYVPTQHLTVSRFDDYFRQDEVAKLDAVQFLYVSELSSMYIGLQRGDYDLAGGVDSKQFADRTASIGLNVVSFGLGASVALFLDTHIAPFDDIRVRRAFAHAIDKATMAAGLYGATGQPWESPVPIGSLGHTFDLPIIEYSPDTAKALLAEAGYPNGIDISVLMSDHAVYSPPMVVLQDMLRASNIRMELQTIEHSTYHTQIREHLTPVVLYSALRPPDAGIWLREFLNPAVPSTNFSRSTVTADILRAIEAEGTVEGKVALYEEAQRIIVDEVITIPLYRRLAVQALQTWVSPNYEIVNTAIYYPDHLEFFTIDR